MSRTLLVSATIAVSSALMPYALFAEDAPSTAPTTQPTTTAQPASPTEMPKDAWLSQMSPVLPDLVCKGFMADADLKKRFDDLKITYEKCVGLIPDISTKCQGQIYANIPATVNETTASTWGRSLGECIGKNFAEQYLIPKAN